MAQKKPLPPQTDPLSFYWTEEYLFRTVRDRFHTCREIGAFDLFAIVMWKSNRSKSKEARRLAKCGKDLDTVVRALTRELHAAPDKLQSIMKKPWSFRLSTASAILAVLWPDEFSVLDVRACAAGAARAPPDFSGLAGLSYSDRLARGYAEYIQAVVKHTPSELCLRDKDRFLWGKSASEQLQRDIENGFAKNESTTNKKSRRRT